MKVTHRREGELLFGMVDIPLQPGAFGKQESEVSFYFEIDAKTMTPKKYEDGKLVVGCNIAAEFEYSKGKGFKLSARDYEGASNYASAIEGAIKDFEYYVKISSTL